MPLFIGIFLGHILGTAITSYLGHRPLTEIELQGLLVRLWVTAMVAIVYWMLNKKLTTLQEKIDGLAKGQATQGTREQGRDTAWQVGSVPQPTGGREDSGVKKPYVLKGHWHNGFRLSDGSWHEAYDAWSCDYNVWGYTVFNRYPTFRSLEDARRCPVRNPFSTR